MIYRVFVEKKEQFDVPAAKTLSSLERVLGIRPERVRRLLRYDVEGLTGRQMKDSIASVFSEPNTDKVFSDFSVGRDEKMLVVQLLDGQYDQRADSAMQCVQFLTGGVRPLVRCAEVYIFKGVSDEQFLKIKRFLINPVDSREGGAEMPDTLADRFETSGKMREELCGFNEMDESGLKAFHGKMGLAMTVDDLRFVRDYFREKGRQPTLTELKVVDTYWSDHCRHTTFSTRLKDIKIVSDNPDIPNALEQYRQLFEKHNVKGDKVPCLMSIATIAAKELKSRGLLNNLDESDEINACSVVVDVDVDGKDEQWLIMFKNETHNHPTEIEPFGGAATCLGGAIRDPLSGRSYVYQAMRVTGAADPRTPFENTLQGKLPQRKIVTGAANGYSSYGNQIGLATGQVTEIYDEGYVAKRMEIGAVVAAAPRNMVYRGTPEKGDIILLVGGRTGRDGIGGATGSSKDHTEKALENSAEVQKGDAPMERKLQRLFRNPQASLLIKRCNDFGAGGVSVAIGELAPSLEINLDAVPKKYRGLDGTELAISESQERMAVVVSPSDAEKFKEYAAVENLECTHVADVTDSGRLVMKWKGDAIVNLLRKFLDTNGTTAVADAEITEPAEKTPFDGKAKNAADKSAWLDMLSSLNCCSQRGLVERFDSSIGASAVLHPYGGKNLSTAPEAMCSKIPLLKGDTNTGTLFSFGFNPDISKWSPFHGAQYAVLESVAKIAASGGDVSRIRFTFQEYFEKLRDNPVRWGKPLAALLGAFEAQMELGCASIGGKDSMSGSFNDIDVPPTLCQLCDVPVRCAQRDFSRI